MEWDVTFTAWYIVYYSLMHNTACYIYSTTSYTFTALSLLNLEIYFQETFNPFSVLEASSPNFQTLDPEELF